MDGTGIKQIGNLTQNTKRKNPARRRVYDVKGVSPTIQAAFGQGGNLQPHIIVTERKKER